MNYLYYDFADWVFYGGSFGDRAKLIEEWTMVDAWFLERIKRRVRVLEKLTQMTIANNRNNFEITLWFNMARLQEGKDAGV